LLAATLFNLFYLFPPFAYILVMTLSGFSALALFVVARQWQPPAPQHRTVSVSSAACLIVLAVQVLTAQFAPITIIVQSQIIRAGGFILIFGYVYFADFLARTYRGRLRSRQFGRTTRRGVFILGAATGAAAVWVVQRLAPGSPAAAGAGWRDHADLCRLGFAIAIAYDAWQPGIHIFGPRTAWETPNFGLGTIHRARPYSLPRPISWWLYTSDWRVFSERSR
jgi:hypothetical protein